MSSGIRIFKELGVFLSGNGYLVITSFLFITGALKDFDKVDKKTATADGESSKQSDTTAAALADLPPGWNDEFLK